MAAYVQAPTTTKASTAMPSPHDAHVTSDAHSEQMQELLAMMKGGLDERMGIEVVEASAERVVLRMPVAGNTQPMGLLHGGANVVLAESAGSIGANLAAGPGRHAVGLDINATHHRAVKDGMVTATASAISIGRTLAAYEVVITDERDRRTCTARITCMLLGNAANR